MKEDEIGMGIAGQGSRVRGQAKVFIREETNRGILNRENFGETKGGSARRKGQAPAAKAGDQLSGRILTDRSDSQIAEDPESVSTAQGC